MSGRPSTVKSDTKSSGRMWWQEGEREKQKQVDRCMRDMKEST
jgi:hypothetical protein